MSVHRPGQNNWIRKSQSSKKGMRRHINKNCVKGGREFRRVGTQNQKDKKVAPFFYHPQKEKPVPFFGPFYSRYWWKKIFPPVQCVWKKISEAKQFLSTRQKLASWNDQSKFQRNQIFYNNNRTGFSVCVDVKGQNLQRPNCRDCRKKNKAVKMPPIKTKCVYMFF